MDATTDELEVRVNGEERTVPGGFTVRDLVRELHLDRGGIAVEINRSIVPRSTHETHVLRAGDAIEIVTIMGGG